MIASFSSVACVLPPPNPSLTKPKLFLTSLLNAIGVCALSATTCTSVPLSEGRLPEYDTRVFRAETLCIEVRGEDGRDGTEMANSATHFHVITQTETRPTRIPISTTSTAVSYPSSPGPSAVGLLQPQWWARWHILSRLAPLWVVAAS